MQGKRNLILFTICVLEAVFMPVKSFALNTNCMYLYSEWGECGSDGTQRRILQYSPFGVTCSNSPRLSQACTYTTPAPACTSFTYSAWGTCTNGTQTRATVTSSPAGCVGTSSPDELQQNCDDQECGSIKTVAGSDVAGFSGDGGPATQAGLSAPWAVAIGAAGSLLIADYGNNRVRKVDASGNISTVSGNGTASFSGDNGPATDAGLRTPSSAAYAQGNMFIADYGNSCVRKVDESGIISTVAGIPTVAGNSPTLLRYPRSIALDYRNDTPYLYIADTGNNRIQKADLKTGNVETIVGTGVAGFSGDGALAIAAQLKYPEGIAIDPQGNIFVGDTQNHRVRKIDAGTHKISTVAGTGEYGSSGDGGPAIAAKMASPSGVVIDSQGKIFIADTYNYKVRRIDANGIITTVAGKGTSGFSGDGGPATAAELNNAESIAIDAVGNLFIAEQANQRVRKVRLCPDASAPSSPPPPAAPPSTLSACTSFTYSSWSSCTNGTQKRTVATSSPTGCSGGTPITSQSCTSTSSGSQPGTTTPSGSSGTTGGSTSGASSTGSDGAPSGTPIFRARFSSDAIDTLPGIPEIGEWRKNESAGSIRVRSSVGDLKDQPVELNQTDGPIGGVDLRGSVCAVPRSGQWVVKWQSLLNSSDASFAPIVIRGPGNAMSELVIASVEYRENGHITYNDHTHDIGIKWDQGVSNLFEVVVDLDAKMTSLKVGGVSVTGFQKQPFVQAATGLDFVGVELGGISAQTLAWDNIEISSLPGTTASIACPTTEASSSGSGSSSSGGSEGSDSSTPGSSGNATSSAPKTETSKPASTGGCSLIR